MELSPFDQWANNSSQHQSSTRWDKTAMSLSLIDIISLFRHLPVRLCEYIFTILSSFLITAAVTRPDIAPSCTVANRRAGSKLLAANKT